MNAYLLALALLAPAPAPDPAPQSYTVIIDSRTIGSDGRIYTAKGSYVVTVEDAPLPPPGPEITALKNAAGQGVEIIRAGDVLVIEGTGLWNEKAQVRVQLPGRTATLLSTGPTRLEVRFPAITAPVTGPLQVYHNTGTGWTLVATGPKITINPATLPPGRRRPQIRSYHGLDGQMREVFLAGEPILIRGEGFGSVPGDVEIWYNREAVLRWTDTEILVTNTHNASPWWPQRVAVKTTDGEVSDWMFGPKIVLPGQEVKPTPPPYPVR